MFTFRCPACGKLHTAADAFAATFESRCLRCGDTIRVTDELVHGAKAAVKPAAAAASPTPAADRTDRSPSGMGAEGIDDPTGPDGADVDELPLAEDGESPPPKRPKKKGGSKGRRKRPADHGRSEAYRGEEEDDDYPPGLYAAPPRPEFADAADARPWYKRPPVLIGIAAAVVLLAAGAGAAYYLAAGKGTPTKKEVAKTSKPAPKPAAPTPTAKAPEPKPAAVEAPKPRAVPDVFIAAPRLAAELAANSGVTDLKYKDKLVEVSGVYDGTGTRSKPAPAGQHAFFRTDGARVSCELAGSPTNPKTWQGLVTGEPVTVRGVYGAEGVLRSAELVAQTAPAEAAYRGKEVELVGCVDGAQLGEDSVAAFPTVRLEPETFSPLDVECLFRKSDEAEVRKVPPGTLVTIRGTCSGRRQDEGRYHVRLDNCQFVYTTAPTPPTPRLDVAQFLRTYGEDLRRDLLPPAGSEERLDAPLTATQLARDFTADRLLLDKYRGKVVTVWGRLQGRSRDGLMLEGDDTDKAFRVLCRFSARNLRLLGGGPVVRVRGLCAGLTDGATLRLENCEPFEPEARDTRRLTADYLPHVPGRVLTYDIALWPADGGKPVVVRQTFAEGDNGLIEAVTTHKGTLAGHSLFAPGEQAQWVQLPRTRKVRQPGPVYQRRQSGNFIELGQRVLTRERQVETVWEPVLKVGARLGESWTWAYGNMDHTCTLEKFEEHQGRPAALVRERVVLGGDDVHPVLVRHVYVRDVGEVERQDVQELTRTDRKVTAEKKLVEGMTAGPVRPAAVQK